ncbi:MAG: LysR family transcriptional regulator [Steroidobacteraceae bacterium]
MDTRQLKHFLAVADSLHFGKAAEQLGISQPPLSQSIMALERELGAALFIRTKRSVKLTPFAEQWLVQVRSAMAAVAALPETARRLRFGEAGRLELSFVTTADYTVVPTLVRRYRSAHPDVDLVLTESTSDIQIAALADGKGHAGIIIPPTHTPLPEVLTYRPLTSEPLIAAVPEAWVEEKRLMLAGNQLSASAVIDSPLIVFPRHLAPAFYDLVMGYYTASGGHARIVQHAIQMQTIISLVSAGMGIAIVPQSLRHMARTGVRYLDLQGEVPNLDTGIVWRRDDSTPTLKRFLEVVSESY